MNSRSVFCPPPDGPLAGPTDAGNGVIHSRKAERYRCKRCGPTFSARQGTLFFHQQSDAALIACVLTLLAYGCPSWAMVAGFGLDARTVAAWLADATAKPCTSGSFRPGRSNSRTSRLTRWG